VVVTQEIRAAVRLACEHAGGQRAFARQIGVSAMQPGRWIRGEVDWVTPETEDRLLMAIKPYMGEAAAGQQPQALPSDQRALLAYYRGCGARSRGRILEYARVEFMKASGL